MVTKESGIIGQLSQGCCLTDRPIMFLISMLVLSMGMQTVRACKCEEIDWMQLMCSYEEKTIVMTSFLNETTVGSSKIYYMSLEMLIKAKRHNFTDIDSRRFTMVTPLDCSPIYNPSLLEDTLYIIYGDTDINGVLQSSGCNVELYDIEDFYEKGNREQLRDFFWSISERTCRGDS